MPFFTRQSGEKIEVPEFISSEGKKLEFIAEKTLGWSDGGWYQDEDGIKYLAKFGRNGSPFPYLEKLLNDLAKICVNAEALDDVEVLVGHGKLSGKNSSCLLVKEIPDFQDLISIKSETEIESDSVLLRKEHSTKFHPFFAYLALIANDDLNEENLGIDGKKRGLVIDYGLYPTFLNPNQIEFADVPFHLASFIGHRNLNGMQLIRRRHFGHDEFLDPRDRLKLQTSLLKDEDISYLEILQQAKRIIESKEEIDKKIELFLENVSKDESLDSKQKEEFLQKYQDFGAKIQERISWMEKKFATDLAKLADDREVEIFGKMKWRLHPAFKELMEFEEESFKTCAKRDLEANMNLLAEKLECESSEDLLKRDLNDEEKESLHEISKGKLLLHNAIIARDFNTAKYLVENDICSLNEGKKGREHNYQLFRTTPLHAAIAIYHDDFYAGKKEQMSELAEFIEFAKEKFYAVNGKEFNSKARDYKTEGANEFEVKLTFSAIEKYERLISPKAQAATTIQRAFRASRLKVQNQTAEINA